MTVTDLLATWGAIVATAAVVWNILRDRGDRGRLKLDAMIGRMYPDHTDRDYVFLTITNIGRRPVFVKGWGGRQDPDADGHHDGFLTRSPNLPRMLKEGEYVHVFADDLTILGPEIREIHVWDSTGKTWKLSRKALTRLRTEAQDIVQADAATTR